MKNSKKKDKTSKLGTTERLFLVKEAPKIHLKNSFYDSSTLKEVLKHLKKRKKMKISEKEKCPRLFSLPDVKADNHVKLKCRQLPNVVVELRKAILRQDWDEATTLVTILCHPGLKLYSSIIIRVCFILLFNHPNSNSALLQSFTRLMTDYILEEHIDKYIRILFALRKTPLKPLEPGKYIRKAGDFKVVRDPEFEGL